VENTARILRGDLRTSLRAIVCGHAINSAFSLSFAGSQFSSLQDNGASTGKVQIDCRTTSRTELLDEMEIHAEAAALSRQNASRRSRQNRFRNKTAWTMRVVAEYRVNRREPGELPQNRRLGF